ncbi:MAG TPA: cation:proton antiporter [Gemmatimonadaceae bacterium]|jgi:CPA2 family monovalent cation:H+ antiporter-2|nr:cation:proton antiporter [Gemmatimonadaceae bacterium]
MDNAHTFLENLALVLCTAAVTSFLFQRLKLPVVFGYLVAGMIVGPYLPIPLHADERVLEALSELGVILLMFSLGLEFQLKKVGQIAATSGLAALLETSTMLALGYFMGQLLGFTKIESVFTGAIVAISSTTIIARAFEENNVRGKLREVVFGILIVEDLIAIILIALLTAIATGAGMSAWSLTITIVRLVTFLLGLVIVGILLVPRFVRGIVKLEREETTLVGAIGLCFAAAFLAYAFGYSVALGAFIMGSLVAESGESGRIERLVHPVRDMFVAIFFVSVGSLIDPRLVLENWVAVVALSALVIAGKTVAVSAGAFITGAGLRHSIQTGMSLAQIGEFSFIIAGVGLTAGVTRGFMYPVAVAVSAITTLFTPLLIKAAEPAAMWIDRKMPRPMQTSVALYASWVDRMRNAPPTQGRSRTKSLIRLILVDAALLTLVLIGAGAERGRFTTMFSKWTGASATTSMVLVIIGAAAIATPLMLGMVRSARMLGFVLAMRALPNAGRRKVDFAAAPRRALVTMLQMGTLLLVGVPIVAVSQPFIPGFPGFTLLAILTILLGFAFWKSALNLQEHARAGAEVIVAALTPQVSTDDEEENLFKTMEHVAIMLPGLGEPVPVKITYDSPAVDRALSELNVRGKTGATILAITRRGESGNRVVVPSGKEVLREGDVLALAGTQEAVDAAVQILTVSRRRRPTEAELDTNPD